MVQQVLNRHSQIVIPPETKFFLSFFGYSRRRQMRYIEQINADLGIQLPQPATPIQSLEDGRAFFEEIARLYTAKLDRQDALYFGEKTPWHTGYLPLIREMFPEAKILVVYRDGRDVALSLSQVPWMTSNLYVNFLVWLYYSRVLLGAKAQGWPNLHFARYEDIVADPETGFRDILQFLDLPYEPVVARGQGSRECMTAQEYPWKARALGKITPERVGVFREQLRPEQIGILERLGGQSLSALGYPLLTDGRQSLPVRFFLARPTAWVALDSGSRSSRSSKNSSICLRGGVHGRSLPRVGPLELSGATKKRRPARPFPLGIRGARHASHRNRSTCRRPATPDGNGLLAALEQRFRQPGR